MFHRNIFDPAKAYIVAGVYRNVNPAEDQHNHRRLTRALANRGISYQECRGGYTHDNGHRVEEQSVAFPAERFREFREDGFFAGQEAVLTVSRRDHSAYFGGAVGPRHVMLTYLDGRPPVYHGVWQSVSFAEAMAAPGFTYLGDEIERSYYIAA